MNCQYIIQHEPRLVERLLIALCHVGLVEVQIDQLLDENQNQLRVFHKMRRRDEEHNLGLLRVPAHRTDNRVGLDLRELALLREIQNLLLLELRLGLAVDDSPVFLLELPQFREDTVLDDFLLQNRVLHVHAPIQRGLIALGELEIKSPDEITRSRVPDLQPDVGRILGILPVEIVPRPALAGHHVLVVELLPQLLGEVLVLERVPYGLLADEMV